jgi:hypothetical protein
MEEFFQLIKVAHRGDSMEEAVYIGVRVKMAGHETECPITRTCSSLKAFEIEVQALMNQLERIKEKAKKIFRATGDEAIVEIKDDMAVEEIWSLLSGISDDILFVEGFNGLGELKRKEVAEHVLTRCNIFSGKASTFSSRYNSESGLLE